jgi:hypothetical protein
MMSFAVGSFLELPAMEIPEMSLSLRALAKACQRYLSGTAENLGD